MDMEFTLHSSLTKLSLTSNRCKQKESIQNIDEREKDQFLAVSELRLKLIE